MPDAFQVGDVVELKSGGPNMTVESLGKDAMSRDYAHCAWFDGAEKKVANFAPATLKKSGGS